MKVKHEGPDITLIDIKISYYPIEPTESDPNASILITTARGWNGEDIYRFSMDHSHQKSVVSDLKWNYRKTKLIAS